MFLPSAVAFFRFPFFPVSHLCFRVFLEEGQRKHRFREMIAVVPIASGTNGKSLITEVVSRLGVVVARLTCKSIRFLI